MADPIQTVAEFSRGGYGDAVILPHYSNPSDKLVQVGLELKRERDRQLRSDAQDLAQYLVTPKDHFEADNRMIIEPLMNQYKKDYYNINQQIAQTNDPAKAALLMGDYKARGKQLQNYANINNQLETNLRTGVTKFSEDHAAFKPDVDFAGAKVPYNDAVAAWYNPMGTVNPSTGKRYLDLPENTNPEQALAAVTKFRVDNYSSALPQKKFDINDYRKDHYSAQRGEPQPYKLTPGLHDVIYKPSKSDINEVELNLANDPDYKEYHTKVADSYLVDGQIKAKAPEIAHEAWNEIPQNLSKQEKRDAFVKNLAIKSDIQLHEKTQTIVPQPKEQSSADKRKFYTDGKGFNSINNFTFSDALDEKGLIPVNPDNPNEKDIKLESAFSVGTSSTGALPKEIDIVKGKYKGQSFSPRDIARGVDGRYWAQGIIDTKLPVRDDEGQIMYRPNGTAIYQTEKMPHPIEVTLGQLKSSFSGEGGQFDYDRLKGKKRGHLATPKTPVGKPQKQKTAKAADYGV